MNAFQKGHINRTDYPRSGDKDDRHLFENFTVETSDSSTHETWFSYKVEMIFHEVRNFDFDQLHFNNHAKDYIFKNFTKFILQDQFSMEIN